MTPAAEALRDTALVHQVDALRAELSDLRRELQDVPRAIPVPSIARLVAAVAVEFDLTERAILSPRRDAAFVTARQVVMHLAVTQLCKSLPTIGRCLQRDHTTVLHGSRVIARRICVDPDLAARVARVAAAIEPPLETRA
jgi:chromosomal replication initiation ATPase DnaA